MDKRTKFLVFLANHNALIPFINNIDLEKSNFFQYKPEYWMIMAFTWTTTPEGYNYWTILNNTWVLKCTL